MLGAELLLKSPRRREGDFPEIRQHDQRPFGIDPQRPPALHAYPNPRWVSAGLDRKKLFDILATNLQLQPDPRPDLVQRHAIEGLETALPARSVVADEVADVGGGALISDRRGFSTYRSFRQRPARDGKGRAATRAAPTARKTNSPWRFGLLS